MVVPIDWDIKTSHWVLSKPVTTRAMKSARLFSFRLSEMGINIPRPLVINVDATAAISLQRDTCVDSQMKGTFDLRKAWVLQLQDRSKVICNKVDSNANISDMGTKCHSAKDFNRLRRLVREQ